MFAETKSTEHRLWQTFTGVSMDLALANTQVPITLSIPTEVEPESFSKYLNQLMREFKLAIKKAEPNSLKVHLSSYFVIVITSAEGSPIATVLQQSSLDFLGLDGAIWFFGGGIPLVNHGFENLDPCDSMHLYTSTWNNILEMKNREELWQGISNIFFWKTRLNHIGETCVAGNIIGVGKVSVASPHRVGVTDQQEFLLYPKYRRRKRNFMYPSSCYKSLQNKGNLPRFCELNTNKPKRATFFPIITVELPASTATDWIHLITSEGSGPKKKKPLIILALKDSDAFAEFIEQFDVKAKYDAKAKYDVKAINSPSELNFVQELLSSVNYAICKQGPAFALSGTLIVTHYWDELFALSPFVREILNRIFFPGI